MKIHRLFLGVCALALAFSSGSAGFAHEAHKKQKDNATAADTGKTGKLVPLAEKDAAWAAKARKEYPMDVCLTSDEKLGSMGENVELIYREPGKPDRFLMFCCKGCDEDFLAEPAKYLAKLDAAAKAKKSGGHAPADKAHKGHH